MVGLDRSDSFVYLLERVIQRLKGWTEKHLSLGAKEILVKAVIQSIPVYAMAVFKIPKKLCKEINDAMSAFWWGDSDDQKRMHWFAWWRMCIPKKLGGMGFRDLYSFNLAMLAKQSWRILNNPNSLCSQVLRSKYFPDGNFLKAEPKRGSSFTWQSILAGLQTFRRGHIWRVGTGTKINIWEDHWVPNSHNRKIQTRRGNILLRTVDELINPDTGVWDEEMIKDVFFPVDVENILRIPLSDFLTEDFVAWNMTRTSLFSVRSAYYTKWDHQFGARVRREDGQGSSTVNPVWDIVWKLKIPSKIKIFIWKALHGTVACYGVLASRHIPVSGKCPICSLGLEDIQHLLFTWTRSRQYGGH